MVENKAPFGYSVIGSVLYGFMLGILGYIIGGFYDAVVSTGMPNFAFAVAAALFSGTVAVSYWKDVKGKVVKD